MGDTDGMPSALKKKYEHVAAPRLEPGDNDAKQAFILNRVLRWTSGGGILKLTLVKPKG